MKRCIAILWFVALSLGLAVSTAVAATSITATFIPSPPQAEQPLVVRMTDTQGPHCWPVGVVTQGANGVITLSLTFSDTCPPANVVAYRDYVLGTFPTGKYVFVYKSCSDNPPPFPVSCNVVLQIPFIVPLPPPARVPALSWWGIAALIASVVAICSWVAARARRD